MKACNLLPEFCQVVQGFADTLPIFKAELKDLKSFSEGIGGALQGSEPTRAQCRGGYSGPAGAGSSQQNINRNCFENEQTCVVGDLQ